MVGPGARIRVVAIVGAVTVALGACDATSTPAPSPISPAASLLAPTPTPTEGPSPTPGWSPLATVTLGPGSLDGSVLDQPERAVAVPSGFLALSGVWGRSWLLQASAAGTDWQLLDASPFGGDPPSAIAVSQGRIVLATTAVSAGESTRLWFSGDGRTWGEDHDPPASHMDATANVELAGGPAGFALTGNTNGSGDGSRVLWTSLDGQHWAKAAGVDPNALYDVSVLDGGFLTVDPENGWTASASADGVTWWPLPASAPTELVRSWTGVTVPLDDGLIALSSSDPSAPTYAWRLRVSVFATSATAEWAALGVLPSSVGASVVAGTSTGRGIALLGYDAAYRPLTWTSRDASHWVRNVLPETDFGGGVPSTISGGPGVYLALGWNVDTFGQSVVQPWISTDGATWSPVASDAFGATVQPTGVCPTATSFDLDHGGFPLGFQLAPDCFGSRTLTFRGWARDCGGCGGTGPDVATPSWLISPLHFYRFWLGSEHGGPGIGGGGIGMQVAPGVFVPGNVPPNDDSGIHVELTGHFDDPAAATCRIRPSIGSGAQVLPVGEAVATCKQTFVVTHIQILP